MFQAVKEAFGFGKPAVDEMATMQTDPALPTVAELDKAAAARVTAAENAALEMRYQRNDARENLTKQTARADAQQYKIGELLAELNGVRAERDAAWITLREIAGMETPGSAPAAKRMARVAREGLPEYAAGELEAA